MIPERLGSGFLEKITRLPLGALASNCYIIAAENNKAVVIDPASSAEVLMSLERNDLTLGGIVITHGHYDHFAGAAELKERTDAPVYAPDLDAEMLQSAEKSWARFMAGVPFKPVTPDRVFSDGEEFTVCGITFRVMAAPGHTAGSCLLFCEELNAIFTGDVIFCGSIGRTDGFSGSEQRMTESLAKIRGIDGDYALLCGHGETSTLAEEKRFNPYLYNC